jgi:hypothetical protein
VHQDRAEELVRQGSDGADVIDVGVGYDDLAYRQTYSLDGEHDTGCFVARVDEGSRPRLLVADDVTVLLERPDGYHLDYHLRLLCGATSRPAS